MQSISSFFRHTCLCYSSYKSVFNNFRHPPRYFYLGSKNIRYGESSITSPKINEKSNYFGVQNLLNQIQKDNKVQIKTLKNIIPNISNCDIEENHIIVLLNCCGRFVPNESLKVRNEMCQEVFQQVLKKGQLTTDICNNYIQVCTQNCTVLNYREFLTSIKFEPNLQTYKAFLKNVCEGGDVEQLTELLTEMKTKDIPIDEEDLNYLVLAKTIQRGIEGAQSVINTIEANSIIQNAETNYQILKGLAIRNNLKEFEDAEKIYKFNLNEDQFLQILEKIGYNGNLEFLLKIFNLFGDRPISKNFILKVDYLCLHLIHMKQSELALKIYEKLVPPVTGKKYGHFLLREMLICREPIELIIQACKNIKERNLNPYSLENTAEIALRLEFFEDALEFYKHFENLRPHFYWPLLINSYKTEGEGGVIEMLKIIMSDRRLKIDQETLQNYVIPFCNYQQPKLLIQSLKNCDLTVKEILSPILVTLLKKNQLDLALKTCQDYNVGLDSDPLVKILAVTWVETKKSGSLVTILQKVCETNDKSETDYVGNFLIKTLQDYQPKTDLKPYLDLLQIMNDRKLRLTSNSAEILSNILGTKCTDKEWNFKIDHAITNLLDLTFMKKDEFLPHPNNMTVEQLECHLEELKHKNMETRGVLRKLIQNHCNLRNFERVQQLREEFLSRNYRESPGMKSSLLHSYVNNDNVKDALKMYEDLTKNHRNFKLDSYKIIDLANLLVKNDRSEEALTILKSEVQKNERHVQGGSANERNCWELLKSYKNPKDQLAMFDFLLEKRICKPSNIILGPLIRIHLNNGDLKKSVDMYEEFTDKYKSTPLQLELLLESVKDKNPELTERILEATVKIHGQTPTLTTLLVALVENGNKNGIKKILSQNVIPTKGLIDKYDRWIKEDKLEALKTLEKVGRSLTQKIIDLNPTRIAILKILSIRNDCQSAVEFYQDLVNNEQQISTEFELQLVDLLKKSQYEIPENLAVKIGNKN